MTNQTSFAFQILHIILPINISDGYSLSNEVHRELLLKKSKIYIMLNSLFIFTIKAINWLTLQHASVLKMSMPCWLKDWRIVLQ